MLNIAGPEYDYASVVFVVLQECEHRRRSWEDDEVEEKVMATAKEKLAAVKASYDEFGGSASYWQRLQKEVLDVVMPQYVEAARQANAREKSGYGIWRGGDPGARAVFALAGLVIGSIIIALPFIRIAEDMFAFALTVGGALYPDMIRYTHDRRHSAVLNRLVSDSAAYQENARLHYMTLNDIQTSLVPGEDPRMLGRGHQTAESPAPQDEQRDAEKS